MINNGVELSSDEHDAINLPINGEVDNVMVWDIEMAIDAILQYSAKIDYTSSRHVPDSTENQIWRVTEDYDRRNSIHRDLRPQQFQNLIDSHLNLIDESPSMGDIVRLVLAHIEAIKQTN